MKIKHLLYLSVLLASVALAEGPVFAHKEPVMQQEFENVYKDIRGVPRVSSTTLPSGSTQYIQNGTAIQSATFNTSSGTAAAFTATTITAKTYQTGGIPVLRISTSEWSLSNGVTTTLEYDGSNNFVDIRKDFVPSSDNALLLGKTGLRWSAVWAANGTIQTSASTEKRDLREIVAGSTITIAAVDAATDTFRVPRGIVFKWKDRLGRVDDKDLIGFNGDDLPAEAHAIKKDGTRDPENFYTSAVLGLQAAAIRDLQRRVAALEADLKNLQTLK